MDARHLGRRDQEIPVFGADTEPVAPSQELLFRCCFATGIVHTDIVHVNTALILAVEASHICLGAVRFDDDRDAMQILMTWMKDVAGHGPPLQTVAPKCRSKAAVKSAAID